MTCKEIIAKYLKDNGFDGLVADWGQCGCQIDDLMPCDCPFHSCQPGYKGPDLTGESEWLIYPDKASRNKAVLEVENAQENS